MIILIVDDSVDTAHAYRKSLEDGGYCAECAYTANEALCKVRKQTPLCVLLDYSLPDSNGIECARRMRELPAMKPVPIVLWTVYPLGSPVYAEAAKAGFTDVRQKPNDPADVVREVEVIFRDGHSGGRN